MEDLPNTLYFVNYYDNNKQKFNKQLNCLPNTISEIKLPINYDQEIKIIPFKLNKIICSSSYKFINNFNSNILIEKID